MHQEIKTLHYFSKDLLASLKETNNVQVSAIGTSNLIASTPIHTGKTRNQSNQSYLHTCFFILPNSIYIYPLSLLKLHPILYKKTAVLFPKTTLRNILLTIVKRKYNNYQTEKTQCEIYF